MILRITMLILLGWSTYSYAHFYKRTQADSIRKSLTGQEGTTRVKSLLNLAQVYYDFNLDTSLFFANQALIESQKTHYDWGYYKSTYAQAKVFYNYYPASEVIPIIENSAQWFYNNGFYADAIRSDLSRSNMLARLKGINAVQELDHKILKRAQAIKDPVLLGEAWYGIKRHKSQIIENGLYTHCVDSAKYYFELTKDSARLMQISLYDILNHCGADTGFYMIYNNLNTANRWGNNKLISSMNVFALLGHAYTRNQDSVKYYYDKSLKMLEARGTEFAKMQVYNFGGIAARVNGDLLKAIELYQKTITICTAFESNQQLCINLKEMSKIYLSLDEKEKAIDCLLKAMDYAKRLDDEYILNTSKVYLGKIYKSIGEFEKGKKLCLEAIPWINTLTKEDVKNKTRGACFFVLGEIYQEQKQYDSALVYFNWANEDYDGYNPLSSLLAQVNIVSVYSDLNETSKADSCFQLIVTNYSPKYREFGPPFFLEQGRLMINQGQYLEGITSINTYLDMASDNNQFNPRHKKAYLNLYMAYERTGQFEKALIAHVNYKKVADSISNGQEIQNIAKIQSDYEISLREAEIVDLNKQKELVALKLTQQESELKLRQSYFFILIFLVLFVAVIVYFLFRRFKLKKEREKALLKASQMELRLENMATKKKVEMAEVKNAIFSNVSHEFRTPLTLIRVPILNYLEKLPETDQPIFENVLSNTDELLKMIDELLDLGKMEAGHLRLVKNEFDLSLFFTQLTVNFAHLFKAKNIQFEPHIDAQNYAFKADEKRLKVVFNNLLKNAYAHTPEFGKISISVKKRSTDKKTALEVVVTNTGSQIATSDLPHLFERYYRANEKAYKGNGIGLAISQQIAKLHDGEIIVSQNENGKVSFKTIIPGKFFPVKTVSCSITAEKEDGLAESSTIKRQSLLIVEDHQEMRELLKEILKKDFDIQLATNGEIGERMAIDNQPALVLSDVMMPVKGGFELLKALKSNIETSHIPVLLLTAKTELENQLHGLEQDAVDYLQKPFDPSLLKARIHNILRQRKQLHEAFENNPLIPIERVKCPPLDATFLKNTKSILEEKFSDGNFTVTEFCAEIGLNRNSVYKKIKAYTNQTTSEYIKNFRLEKAVHLLLGSDDDITNIYLNCGFNSGQAFNKAFKQRFKDTPTDYRKKKRVFQ